MAQSRGIWLQNQRSGERWCSLSGATKLDRRLEAKRGKGGGAAGEKESDLKRGRTKLWQNSAYEGAQRLKRQKAGEIYISNKGFTLRKGQAKEVEAAKVLFRTQRYSAHRDTKIVEKEDRA